jgi:hypothetical protein
MGVCCTNLFQNELNSTLIAKSEDEIEFLPYSSIADSHLEFLEKDNNLLRYITLVEYLNLLSNYTPETAEIPFEGPYKLLFSYKDKFLSNTFNEELFQSFINNTILKGRDLGETEITFKEIYIQLFKELKLKLIEHYGDENKKITKRDLICLGLLFCKTNNISKIKLLFDLFKNEYEEFEQSDELDEFLLCSFLISSHCLISAKYKLSQINPMITGFALEDLNNIFQIADLKKSEKLLNYFNFYFFDKNALTWIQFKKKFEDKKNGFGWIFSTKGIREKLQEINQN